MKKITRILCAIMAILMLLGSVVACSKKTDEGESDGDVVATTTKSGGGEGAEENGIPEANVPDVDMDGKIFTVVVDDWWGNSLMINDDFSATMITGDTLKDAQFMAIRSVKERFNCDLMEIRNSGPSASVENIRTDYTAGILTIDIYLARIQYWHALAQEGILRDLTAADTPYLDFDMPWWDSNSVKELSLGGSLYAVAGDFSLQDEYMTSCVAFNKQILADQQLADPYQMVRDNNWTFETFFELSSAFGEDDGDGKWDEYDKYGFMYQRDTLSAMIMSSGGAYAKKDADDIPYVSINEPLTYDIIDAAMDVLYHPSSVQCMNLPNYVVTRDKMFKNNQVLFCYFYMTSLIPLRQMETDFGILPVPKYSSDQTEWNSEVSSWSATVTCLPILNEGENLEWTCIFLEALGCENRKNVMPAYYDKLLNGQVVRDPQSQEMLDIIFENRMYDIGGCCNFASLTELIYLTMDNSREVSSFVGGRVRLAGREIDSMMANLAKLKS